MSEDKAPPEGFDAWLRRNHVSDKSRAVLVKTYSDLRDLIDQGKDHIWGYVARNLARPIWLASPSQKADVIVGNPPWLANRHMAPVMQDKFREEASRLGVATGKAAARDLSGYFFARCVELYLRDGGKIAFVLPYAAMSRSQFRGLRTGDFGSRQSRLPGAGSVGSALRFAQVTFTDAWTFDNTVRPLFNVPSCVLFATEGAPAPLPPMITSFHGLLPRRDATYREAASVLSSDRVPWPKVQDGDTSTASGYRMLFKQGAPLVPRMLVLVERVSAGALGSDPEAPVVASRRSPQEDRVWKGIDSLEGSVERDFLRPAYLSRCILPFRTLAPELAIVPFDSATSDLLGATEASRRGFAGLADWLARAEELWTQHGQEDVKLTDALDFFGSLTGQLSTSHPVRVVYPEAGSQPAAAIVRDPGAIIDHDLYWHSVSADEAYYLAAVLNSEELRSQIAEGQSLGLFGRRHFSKVVFDVPIPKFDSNNTLHAQLSAAGRRAEAQASSADVANTYFVNARKVVRSLLKSSGTMQRIDALVAQLIPRSITLAAGTRAATSTQATS
jgi:hypothetical protein